VVLVGVHSLLQQFNYGWSDFFPLETGYLPRTIQAALYHFWWHLPDSRHLQYAKADGGPSITTVLIL
jgi:hypothetical protein